MSMLGLKSRLALQQAPVDFDLGMPAAVKKDKLERAWLRVWRFVVWPIALSISAIVGYNLPREPHHITEGKPIAYGVQQGKRKCAIDIHEGCLTCEHKSLGGTAVRSTHC